MIAISLNYGIKKKKANLECCAKQSYVWEWRSNEDIFKHTQAERIHH